MVSVIVPIYNVEKYLFECLESLNKQTFDDYEVLLIDDGSTDSSSDIAKKYCKNNSKFQYFRKDNGGLSSARNFGIDKAKGEWLMFVDSDDIVDSYFIEKLHNLVISSNTQIGVCSFKKFQDKEEISAAKQGETKVYSKEEYFNYFFDSAFMAACNKIYKKSLFNDIRYPEKRIHEDFATTYKLIDKVSYISVINEELYNYRFNNNSITLSKIKHNKIDLLEVYKSIILFYKDKKENYQIVLVKKTSNQFFSCFGTLLTYKKDRYENYKDFKCQVSESYKNNYKLIGQLPLSVVNKIIYLLSFKRLFLLIFVSRIKRIIKR